MKKLALFTIEAYQKIRAGRIAPASCRFYPSCSQYAKEAIEAHGTMRGVKLSFRRLLRCRPFGDGGVDLVPLPVVQMAQRPSRIKMGAVKQ